jgi:hypothetical protein
MGVRPERNRQTTGTVWTPRIMYPDTSLLEAIAVAAPRNNSLLPLGPGKGIQVTFFKAGMAT